MEEDLHHLDQTIRCLREHRFIINMEKSHLTPAQSVEHLGAVINSFPFKVFLSKDLLLRTSHLALTVLQTERPDILTLAKL